MTSGFSGWPIEAFDVLLRLDGDPSATIRESCRKDRERLVRRPMVDLLDSLAMLDERYDDFSVWHYGKTAWWWQNQSAVVRVGVGVELSVRFDIDGLHVSGNWGYPSTAQVVAFRRALADDGTGQAFARILGALQRDGLRIEGRRLQRVPRGFDRDHPRGDLLRYRTVIAVDDLGDGSWLHSEEALDRVRAAFERLSPLTSWFADYVGAGENS